jgi:hypothetical protein
VNLLIKKIKGADKVIYECNVIGHPKVKDTHEHEGWSAISSGCVVRHPASHYIFEFEFLHQAMG